MKIAVFHNFMDNIGGAEFVVLTLARGLNADIYTTNIDSQAIISMGYEDVLPRIHSIGKVPKQAPFRQQIALWRFSRLNLGNKYDFYIIAGDWSMSGVVHNKPNMWYVHSPLNELWAFKDFIREKVLVAWKRPLYDVFVWLNRILTRVYSKHVGVWVSNSKNTQQRVEKFYGYTPVVINPPTDTKKAYYAQHENYWLSVNRLLNHKRVEIQMEVMRLLPDEKLIVVGSFEKGVKQFEEYKAMIDSIKPTNVEILHFVEDADLYKLYSECKGFIATAKDEDFGMSVVEALASGKPVIAANEGGYKESVIDGVTGVLIDDIDGVKLAEAMKRIGPHVESYREACLARAEEFDVSVFIKKIQVEIDKKLAQTG